MLIYRNAEGVHGQRKVGNPCDNTTASYIQSGIAHVSISYGHVYDRWRVVVVDIGH